MADPLDRCPHARGHDTPHPFEMHFNGNGLVASQEDEAVEETYFRLIIESPFFDTLTPEDREIFLLTIAQECIQWTLNRKDY